MSDIAIHVDNLGKMYRIGGPQESYQTFRDALTRTVSAPFRRTRDLLRGQAYGAAGLDEEIWALKDISFEVKHGEVVGIIGRNGAGKSTLLKILSRITEPTEGYIDIYGRVGALLEVGTGFHPELTGRENVYLNGAILGMSRKDIDRKFDEIVDFSEVSRFIDTPVKHYSSGMGLRLGFSVAAHLEPDILVVDEVLAVGDAEFQKKCLGKMSDVANQGRTVLFVSHNMGAVAQLCDRVILLDKGCCRLDGPAQTIISQYLLEGASHKGERTWDDGIANNEVTPVKVSAVRIKNEQDNIAIDLDMRNPFCIEIEYEVFERMPLCRVGIVLTTAQGTIVLQSYDGDWNGEGARNKGLYVSRCTIPGNLLSPGQYTLSIMVNIGMLYLKDSLVWLENILAFDIESTRPDAHFYRKLRGVISPELDWQRIVTTDP